MEVVIDRIEGSFAVIELPDGGLRDMPIELVPNGAREGSVITIELNREETEKRQADAKTRLNGLFNRRKEQ